SPVHNFNYLPGRNPRKAGHCLASPGDLVAVSAAFAPFAMLRVFCCRSSVVEHPLGKGEVECSIHSGSTIKIKHLENATFRDSPMGCLWGIIHLRILLLGGDHGPHQKDDRQAAHSPISRSGQTQRTSDTGQDVSDPLTSRALVARARESNSRN